MIEPILFRIGGVVIRISFDGKEEELGLRKFYNKFLTSHQAADIDLTVQYENLPDLNSWEKVFDSGGIWRLWRRSDQFAISCDSPVLQPNRYQLAILDDNFTSGTIYLSKDLSREAFFPINQSLFEILVVNFLSNHKGVMLHACAVQDGGVGRLFSGVSGAGKSTISRIWAGRADALVLSDDRVILRKQDGGFWIYGTPWHGEAGFGSPEGIPLDQICVLKHGAQNRAQLLKPADALARLFVRSFPTFWNAGGMGLIIDLLVELSQTVPCYELSFRPEPEVVDFIRCLS